MLGYDPAQNGNISIAGHNINDYNLKWWRSQCGVVMQDGFIFSESIARNIAVDDGDIEDLKISQKSMLTDDIATADAEWDGLYSGYKKAVNGFKNLPVENMAKAAKELK